MIRIVPNSWGATLKPSVIREHGDPDRPGPYPHKRSRGGDGDTGSGKGGDGEGGTGAGGPTTSYERPKVRRVKDVDEAVEAILKGEVVELAETRQVSTVLKKLAAIANEAKAKGQDAPNYDLCKVTVAGSNLFCASKVTTRENPEGISRLKMPQMGGKPRPGSEAAKLPVNKDGEIDGSDAFVTHLTSLGISTEKTQATAASLKASQAELVGPKVAGMMTAETYDPAAKPIFVSRDNYVVDGHHRWAAIVGRDSEDGSLGDLKMNVIRIDAPISEILHLANKWADQFGILPKAAGKGAKVK